MKTITEIQEAIELLKNETAVFEVTRIGDDKYTLTIKSKPENTIKVGDYLIARKPIFENTTLNWNESMDKYDGVIQKCELITRYGNIATGMNGWRFHPGWCEKVSPGDVMKRDNGDIFIFREIIDGKTFHHAFYNPTYDHLSTSKDCSICSKTPVRAIHATNEEAQPLFNALAKNGKKWNKEKLQVEDIKWVPKAGEFVAHKDGWIHIHKRIEEDGRVKHYAAMSPGGDVYYNDFVGFESDLRGPATESEKKKLIEAIGKEGKQWNEEKMCVEDIPKPKTDEECLRAWGCGEKAIDDYMKYSKKYDMVSKLYAENSFRQLPFIDVLYESYMLDKRKSLKQIIKLCKQLLNE